MDTSYLARIIAIQQDLNTLIEEMIDSRAPSVPQPVGAAAADAAATIKKARGRPKKNADDSASMTTSTTSSRKKPELTEEQRKVIGDRLKAGKAAAKAKKEAAAAAAAAGGDGPDDDSGCTSEIAASHSIPAATPALAAMLATENKVKKANVKKPKEVKVETGSEVEDVSE